MLTPSPSMDILVSSNLERQLFELTGREAAARAGWMADLREQRRFRVDEETFGRVQELFASDSIDNATCLDTIKRVFEQHGYLLDPHTAVAYQTCLLYTSPTGRVSTDSMFRVKHLHYQNECFT